MENLKFKKGEKYYFLKCVNKGGCSRYRFRYVDNLPKYLQEILLNARKFELVKYGNDAPRGGKLGEHWEVIKYFTTKSLARKMKKFEIQRKKELSQVLKSEKIREFETIADIGSFKIENKLYRNFYGDGLNFVEVCKVANFEAFQKADFITKRQVYNKKQSILIEKFENPKILTVFLSDCGNEFETIKNVCGFAIWERHLKIFVC